MAIMFCNSYWQESCAKLRLKEMTFEMGWGPSINYVGRRGGGGLAKCLCYNISLCSKLAYGGGRGVKNWQNLAYVVYGCPPVALL